jgi:hypothetical protein
MKEFWRKPGTVTRTLRVLNVNLPLVLRELYVSREQTQNIVSGVIAGYAGTPALRGSSTYRESGLAGDAAGPLA